MDFKLPNQAFVNKYVPKSKFYFNTLVNTKVKNDFAQIIKKITWQYKLSESTIGINKTESVEEIQIFNIELKQKNIPKHLVKVIDRVIPYPILYIFTYEKSQAYGIVLKETGNHIYYFSQWDEDLQFDFSGINLEKIYQKLIKSFINPSINLVSDFKTIVNTDQKIRNLEKEIDSLKNKIRLERQFNRKVALNKVLLETMQELENIKI